MFYKNFERLKYKFIRYIESNYKINLLIYNNIHLFKFFLPHEKDYYGMLLLCNNRRNDIFLDIGASLGISTLGFRKLGFKNKIYVFEPNYFLYKNYLKKNLSNDKNTFLKNIALGNQNKLKELHMPYYNSNCIHYFCSFDKKYLINSIKITFPKLLKNIKIKKKLIDCRKYDDLKLKIKPHFIKIDTEGFDEYVLKGMKTTIKKYKPIFLVEYNKQYFKKIKSILKDYKPYFYDLKNNKMKLLSSKINQNRYRTALKPIQKAAPRQWCFGVRFGTSIFSKIGYF